MVEVVFFFLLDIWFHFVFLGLQNYSDDVSNYAFSGVATTEANSIQDSNFIGFL